VYAIFVKVIEVMSSLHGTAKAQSLRLEEENLMLRHRLNRQSFDQHSSASLNVEAKIKAFQMEEERDHALESLQLHKKKYNKLHDAYLEKVKRCKALEEMFKRQKTLTGLVMKSAIAQRNSEQRMLLEKRQSQQSAGRDLEVQQLQAKLAKLQTALDEAYDIIDEMDFELESVELLEVQNSSLREEVATLKSQLEAAAGGGAEKVELRTPSVEDDPPPKYEPVYTQAHARSAISSRGSEYFLKHDDSDAESLERAAMTQSLAQKVEEESTALRRELLRSRCQLKMRAKLDIEEAEDKE
ncbi:hypothetical protein KR222_003620, partial [Zaprionus bogoriensis]